MRAILVKYFALHHKIVKEGTVMFQKNLMIGYLLDFYGELLSGRKKDVLEMYYNEDLSLAEIAEEIGISRQGVHEMIKKSEEELRFYEEKLNLASTMLEVEKIAESLHRLTREQNVPPEVCKEIEQLMLAVRRA